MLSLIPLGIILLVSKETFGQCDPGSFVHKSHTWNKGYVGKLYLDQSWLAQQTSDWKLAITFANEVAEFKIWDVEIMNKCYHPILSSCQYLELSFMVRYPEGVSD